MFPSGGETPRTTAIVMNMFCSGLGIARSLGAQGIPVIGLTSQLEVFGAATRYARIVEAPDSKQEPEALLQFLLKIGSALTGRAVVFPTRDHDLVFLSRFRADLEPYFSLVMPDDPGLETCLNKWQTYRAACQAGVDAPRCWTVESEKDLQSLLPNLSFPCVLKPVEAHHWRDPGNWELVGGRKAFAVKSEGQLLEEYRCVEGAEKRALVQELVPGSDECLYAVACYVRRDGEWAAGFTAQKLVQSPDEFGTGCIMRTVNESDLFDRTRQLLKGIGFTGIAEVEYKLDRSTGRYMLIEINPRPWDQLSLGAACGADLVHAAYCDHAGLPLPLLRQKDETYKWIAEDAVLIEALRLASLRDRRFWRLLKLLGGRKTYAIGSMRDPGPFFRYLRRGLPDAIRRCLRWLANIVTRSSWRSAPVSRGRVVVDAGDKDIHV